MPSERDDLLKEKLDMMNPERVDRELFLDNISQLESSGGKNFNHPTVEQGPQQGTQAIGRFGMMPNTVEEILNRAGQQGQATDEMRMVSGQNSEEIKRILEANPQIEYQFADKLAKKVLDTQKDPEKAAYTWFMGHNLSPDEVDKRDYKNTEYVKRFQKLQKKLGGK